jgi:hypothetical protein
MIRLAIAVGFLSVFGIVAYAIVVLLAKNFKDKDRENNNSQKSDR